MEFFIHTLPNGIRCILRKVQSPVVYTALTINAGSRDESARERGIAHFTEHMLFKGTGRRRAYHINCRLEKLGGELNAFTTKEETVVHATTLRDDFAKAAELISDIIFDPSFPEREIEREKEVVINEINSYKDLPYERIYDEFEDTLFAGSPLGHNILGGKSTVGRFTGDDMRSFMKRCYNTDQMIFSVSGNVTEKTFIRMAEKYFAGIPVSLRGFSRSIPPCNPFFTKNIKRSTHQTHCIIGGRAYGNNDNRRVALTILINVLGGPAANSRLNLVLREKNGLTYNAEASYSAYCDSGVAAVYFGTDREKTERCIEAVSKLLTEFKHTALTSQQLAAAKKQFFGQLSISMENEENYMLGAAKSLLIYDEVDSREAMLGKIAAVTSSDIMEAANVVFDSTSMITYR